LINTKNSYQGSKNPAVEKRWRCAGK